MTPTSEAFFSTLQKDLGAAFTIHIATSLCDNSALDIIVFILCQRIFLRRAELDTTSK